jgi:hypothetical protein
MRPQDRVLESLNAFIATTLLAASPLDRFALVGESTRGS